MLINEDSIVESYEVLRCDKCGEMDIGSCCHCGGDSVLVKVIIVKVD